MTISDDKLKLFGLVKKVMVCHAWVEEAIVRAERCYLGALSGGDLRGLIILGESGTGKTRILKHILSKYEPSRDTNGRKVRVLMINAPSESNATALVEELLYNIGDPLFDKGTTRTKTKRLKKLLKAAGTALIIVDEFQHFVDRGSMKVLIKVADWLKVLVDESNVGLIVAGLPYCKAVIESNDQLKRRFQAPLQMPRFNWGLENHRNEFRSILDAMQEELRPFEMPQLSSDELAFRVYCATGGLIGRLANLLVQATSDAIHRGTYKIGLDDLHRASQLASFDMPLGVAAPFSKEFNIIADKKIITSVMNVGLTVEQPEGTKNKGKSGNRIPVSQHLTT